MGLGHEGAKEYLAEIGLARHEDILFPKQDGDRLTCIATDLTGWEEVIAVHDPRKPVVSRAPKGLRGITRYGTKMVRNGCYALQAMYGKARLGFLTLTLPNHPDYLPIWVSRWAEIVRKTLQEIQRELKRLGAPSHLLGVTEIQSKRSDKAGFCVPHFHAVFVAWDGKSWRRVGINGKITRKKQHYISHGKIQSIFHRVLLNEVRLVAEIEPETDGTMPRVEVQAVKKSAEGYLGKYMSKGAKDVKKYLDADPNRTDIPSHWWHCTKELRAIVKGLTGQVCPAMVDAITTNYMELIEAGLVQYLRPIEIDIGGIIRTIGYAGRWKQKFNPIDKDQVILAFGTS